MHRLYPDDYDTISRSLKYTEPQLEVIKNVNFAGWGARQFKVDDPERYYTVTGISEQINDIIEEGFDVGYVYFFEVRGGLPTMQRKAVTLRNV